MFKIETHLHTQYVSKCSHLSAAQIAQTYKDAGYSGICVTDHYSRTTFDYLGIDIYSDCDKLTPFLKGYRELKEECEKVGIKVYKGAEIRFDECANDYLILNWHDNLLAEPAKIFEMGIEDFYKLAHPLGVVIIQAHPYRKKCTPAFACYLDGMEVQNTHPNHDNHNDMAMEYAEEFGLIATGGSDAHDDQSMARGGILMPERPKDDVNYARAIKYRHFTLLQ